MACLNDTAVLQFFAGDLSAASAEQVAQHVDACFGCRALLSASASVSPPEQNVASGVTFAGTTVVAGRYEIVRFIGRGGMGEVYEAEDRELHERIALKTVAATIADDPRMVTRLKREVQLARKVTHPNVCRIFDVGYHSAVGGEQVAFLTMELLQGETLWQRLRVGGRMSARVAAPLVRQMAEALAAAHQAGVIHRDFKSDNVMLLPSVVEEGGLRAVVTDFGLARLDEASPADEAHSATSGVTVGTVGYVSPEQVEGRAATAAADLYALGVVMYEMVTGVWPFIGGTPLSTARKRLTVPPRPPRELVPEIDPAWERLILRCLARDPLQRPASADEVLALLASASTTSSSARPRRGRRGQWLVGGVLAVALLATAGVVARPWLAERGRRPEVVPVAVTATAPSPAPPPAQAPTATTATTTTTIAPRPTGTLLVQVNADDARIEIDGQLVADRVAEARVVVEAGKNHVVTATATGRRAARREVTVGPQATAELHLRLPRVGAAPVAGLVGPVAAPAAATAPAPTPTPTPAPTPTPPARTRRASDDDDGALDPYRRASQ